MRDARIPDEDALPPMGSSTAGRTWMIGLVGWAVLFGLLLFWEGLGLIQSHTDWPTLSDMLKTVTRPVVGRWLLFAVWLWMGWHLFIRGWEFFLRGQVGGPPAAKVATGTGGQLLAQVFVPLVGFYVLFLGLLAANRRPRRWKIDLAKGRIAEGTTEDGRSAVLRHTFRTAAAGYVTFVLVIALYSLVAGGYASGFLSSSISGGFFLTFVVAIPVFLALSAIEQAIRRRRIPPAA